MSFGIPVRNGLSIGLLASTFLTSGSGRLVPRLTLNFLTGAPLDSRITFSRTTNATLVDSTGRVTYAPNNLVLRSEEFDTASWTKDNATITANAAVAPDGTTTADKAIPSNGVDLTSIANGTVRQAVTYSAGATLTFSVFAKEAEFDRIELYFSEATGTANRATVTYSLVDGSVVTAAAVAGTFTSVSSTSTSFGNGWYRFTLTFTTGSGTTARARFAVRDSGTTTGDGTSGILIWGAQLEQVTYQTTPGTYNQTVASAYYGPRFDYNPATLAPLGLLIEEQRVNLLLYSEQLDNIIWTKAGSTITANATTSPDGTVNADKLVENTALAQHRVQQAVTTVIGTSYTHTIYLKAGERTSATLRVIGATTFAGCTINLTAGTISGVTGVGTITNAGNGWYRVSVAGTADSTTSTCFVNLADAGSNTYTGDGVSGAFLYGAQLEAGSFATSYIPTVASTVTRAADNATITGTNFSSWYNASEGTLVSSASVLSTAANRGVYAASDGSSANELFHYVSTAANNLVTTASVSQANVFISGAVSANTPFNDAFAYRQNDISAAINGILGAPDTSATIPSVNQLSLGARGDTNFRLNGHIRTFTFYATRLTNAQLQALTS